MTNPMTTSDRRNTVFIILLCGLFFRAFNIDSLAPSVDETGHLWESVNYSMYSPYDRLLSGKYLGYLFYKPIYLSAWDPLYVARIFTSLVGMVAAFYIYLITRQLYSHFAGLVAIVCYLISPFTYFHDRQAIFDPLATAFFAASIYYFLSGQQRHRNIFTAGFLLFLGMTVKIYLLSGLTFFILLQIAARRGFIPALKTELLPKTRKTLTLFVSGCAVALFGLLITAPTPGYPTINIRKAFGQLFHFLLSKNGETRRLSSLPMRLFEVGSSLAGEYFIYTGIVSVLFILLALVYVVITRQYRWVVLPAVIFISLCSYGILTFVFTRYTHFLQLPVAVFSGSIVAFAVDRLRPLNQPPLFQQLRLKTFLRLESWVIILFLLMTVNHGYVCIRMMHNPYYRIAETDKFAYELGWPSAIGIDEVASALKDIALKSDKKIHVVTIGWGMHGVWTLPLKFRAGGYPVTFLHDWIHSEWQRENLREIMKTSRVLFLLEHPVAFISQKEMLRIGSNTRVLYRYQKKDPSCYYELVEVTQ